MKPPPAEIMPHMQALTRIAGIPRYNRFVRSVISAVINGTKVKIEEIMTTTPVQMFAIRITRNQAPNPFPGEPERYPATMLPTRKGIIQIANVAIEVIRPMMLNVAPFIAMDCIC